MYFLVRDGTMFTNIRLYMQDILYYETYFGKYLWIINQSPEISISKTLKAIISFDL